MVIKGVEVTKRLNRDELTQFFWDVLEEVCIAEYVNTINWVQAELDNPNSPHSKDDLERWLISAKEATLAECASLVISSAHLEFAGADFSDLIFNGKAVD